MRNGLSYHNEGSLLLAGHVRPGPQASQTKARRQSKPLDSVGIPLRRVSAQYAVERLVLKAGVSGEDDDVRRFLRGEGSDLQGELRHSLDFPPHRLTIVLD